MAVRLSVSRVRDLVLAGCLVASVLPVAPGAAVASPQSDEDLLERARRVLEEVPLIDGRLRFAQLERLFADQKLDKYVPQADRS